MNILLQKKFYVDDVGPLLQLAAPLVFGGLVESSLGFFSTIFLARLGEQELAAGSLVTWIFATLMVILWGILTAVSVLVAHKHGEQDNNSVSQIVFDAILLALILVIPTFLLLWNMSPILLLAGQSPAIVTLAQSYLHGLAWGVLPDFIMLVLLQFLIGLGHSRTSMAFTVLWVPIAVFCNYALIFGKFGLPKLGMAGIGWGTTLSYWITAIWLIAYLLLHKEYQTYFLRVQSYFRPLFLKELLQIGIPMGAMYCIEVGFFLALTLLMGLQGNAPLAANQITLQYLGTLTAVVFSIAQAITVRMSHLLGEHHIDSARHACHAGIFLATAFMGMIAILYWFFPLLLISIDFDIHSPLNSELIHYAKQFFVICALFQLLEAIRIALFGALRGLKDNYFTLVTSILSFWCIALPSGYFLATHLKLGGAGLWWGMVLGAFCSVCLLQWRFAKKMPQGRIHGHLSYLTQ